MSLWSYLLYRVLLLIPTLVLVIGIVFLIVHLAPGSPVTYIFGQAANITPADRAILAHQLGLDRPLYVQFLIFLRNELTGNFGYSYIQGASVFSLLAETIPNTLLLMGITMILSIVFGVLIGVYSSIRSETRFASSIVAISQTAYSLPIQWLGLLGIIIFGVYLHWFPTIGMTNGFTETGLPYVYDLVDHLVLPVSLLVIWYMAQYILYTRASMMNALTQDYIVAAKAKGLSSRRIYLTHALRNALLPIVSLAGLQIGLLLTGAVVIETLFGWPGVGRLLYISMTSRDYPVVLGTFYVIAIFVLVGNLISDLTYALIDPRVRYQGDTRGLG
jgi:peptide/nickel transport system permease protein